VIVVFDSGVWISAIHFGGTSHTALDHVFVSNELAICDQIVMEVREVLITKFEWEEREVVEVLGNTYLERLTFV
jgi:hypothetical protein